MSPKATPARASPERGGREGSAGPSPADASVNGLHVPDCEDPWDQGLDLTYEEREELYDSLMHKGVSRGFREYFGRMSKTDSTVSREIERLRRRLESQAARARKEIEAKEARDRESLRARYEPLVVRLGKEEKGHRRRASRDALEDSLDRELAITFGDDPFLLTVLQGTDGTDGYLPPPALSLWERIKAALRRAWRRLVEFLSRLFGRKSKGRRPARDRRGGRNIRTLLDFPSLRGLGRALSDRLRALRTSDPEEAERLESRLLGRRGVKAKGGAGRAGGSGSWGAGAEADAPSDDPAQRVEVLLEEYISSEVERRRKTLEEKARREMEAARRAERRRADAERRRDEEERGLGRRLRREREAVDEAVKERPEKMVRERLLRDLEETGLVRWERGEMVITSNLVERFADIVLSREMRSLGRSRKHRFGIAVTNRGVYEKGRMLDHNEISRMDIVDSLVRARTSHPSSRSLTDDDVVTRRELRGAISHVVLMFDKSGSMEENGRMDAARRAVLALFKAVKGQDSRNSVDLVAFDTRVRVMDLHGVWSTEPDGFTNTQAALEVAGRLLSRSRADRKLIYLITDGLPEAYTHNGEPRAGDQERSLEAAVKAARALRGIEGLRLTVILLEPEEDMYVKATRSIAEAAGGSIITTDPKDLAPELLIDYGV